MIRESLELLKRVRDTSGGKIILGISGGKDSLAVLDLVSRVFEPDCIFGFFLYVLPGLESEEKYVQFAERRYGLAIHRLRHPDMCGYVSHSWLAPVRRPEVEELIPKRLRWSHIETIMRGRTGATWFGYGHRITDSLQRRAMIQRHAGVIEKPRRCYPIWDWKPADVFAYLRANRIPVPPQFGSRVDKTSGIAPHSTECLLYLRRHYPGDFQRIVEAFPRSMELLERDEVRARWDIARQSN